MWWMLIVIITVNLLWFEIHGNNKLYVCTWWKCVYVVVWGWCDELIDDVNIGTYSWRKESAQMILFFPFVAEESAWMGKNWRGELDWLNNSLSNKINETLMVCLDYTYFVSHSCYGINFNKFLSDFTHWAVELTHCCLIPFSGHSKGKA